MKRKQLFLTSEINNIEIFYFTLQKTSNYVKLFRESFSGHNPFECNTAYLNWYL